MNEEQLFALCGRLYAQNQVLVGQVRLLSEQNNQLRAMAASAPEPDIEPEAETPEPKSRSQARRMAAQSGS